MTPDATTPRRAGALSAIQRLSEAAGLVRVKRTLDDDGA